MHTGHALLITLLSLGLSQRLVLCRHRACQQQRQQPRSGQRAGRPENKTYELEQAPKIRVASFNIAAGKVSDMTAIAKAIRAMNVDVVALQEVDKLTARSGRVDQAAELAKLTGMQAVFGRAIDFDGGEYGLAFLSRYPLHDAVIIRCRPASANSASLSAPRSTCRSSRRRSPCSTFISIPRKIRQCAWIRCGS